MMKLTYEVTRPWRISACVACVCVLVLAGSRLPADDSNPFAPDLPEAPAADVDANEDAAELDDRIEITVNGGIRSRTRTEHSTSVTIKNISDEDIEGPLALVVDAAGLDELQVVESDGTLTSGEPYLELIGEDATLRAGASLRPKRVEFESEELIALESRRGFAPEFRVVRLTDEDRSEVAENAGGNDENIPGKSYSQADLDRVMGIQESWTPKLLGMSLGNVFGTSVAEDDQGNLVVQVYTARRGIIRDLPGEIDGVPIQQLITGGWFQPGPTNSKVIYVNGQPVIGGQGGVADRNPPNAIPFPDLIVPGPKPAPGDEPAPEPGDEPGEPTVPDEEPVPDEQPVPDAPVPDEQPGDVPPPDDGPPPNQFDVSNPIFTGTPGDPTVRFDRPVPIGVSSFNLDMGICSAGTLGCRLIDPMGNEFALSNNHVWGGYLAIITHRGITGVALVANPGDVVVQQSPADHPICNPLTGEGFEPLDQIGIVSDFEPILLDTLQNCSMGIAPVNFMDATIAQANPGAIHYCTPPDGYGAPQRDIVKPRIGMVVQKYGRTTVYTSGQITGLNGVTCIPYAPNLYGYFTKQVEIINLVPFGHPGSQGGDSGSLWVASDPGGHDDRKPVALNFAGGPRNAGLDLSIANPIGPVVTRFNMQIDDGSGGPSSAGISGTSGGVVAPLDPPPTIAN